ncbi:MAG: site-2 protease family protein [Clostridia bacterium]|nr:site-2 protease family protein [Clostridia bacterium]
MNIWTILLTILSLSLLILLHELGHYLTARAFGVSIREFAVGMGPKLLSHRSKKTGIVYSIRLLPIGGFVSMVGEDEASDEPGALNEKPVWQRMIITAAGAMTNLLVGVLLMSVVILITPNIGGTTVLRFVEEDALSAASGLAVGDEIVEVDGTRVRIATELSYEIMRNGVEPVEMVVIRDGARVTLPAVQFPTIVEQGVTFGLPDFQVYALEKTFGNLVEQSFFRSASTVKMIWESLIDLLTGRYGFEQMSGPVGVTTAVSEAAKSGAADFLYLIVVISMNLGIFNLLPLPALDGGRLLFQFVELIRRKPIKPEFEGYVHFVGIVLLMMLMVLITFQDVMKLFS